MRKVQCAVVLLAVSACGDEIASEPLVLGDLDAEVDDADIDDADEDSETLAIGGPDGGVQVIGPDGSVQVIFPDLTPPTVDGFPTTDISDAGEGGEALPSSVAISNTQEFPPGAGIGATTGTQTGSGNGINPPSVGGPNAASEAFPPGAGIGATTGTSTGTSTGTAPPSVGGPNIASEAFPPGAGIGATTGTSTGTGPTAPAVVGPNTAGEAFPNAF